jgi:hypothetical protein
MIKSPSKESYSVELSESEISLLMKDQEQCQSVIPLYPGNITICICIYLYIYVCVYVHTCDPEISLLIIDQEQC